MTRSTLLLAIIIGANIPRIWAQPRIVAVVNAASWQSGLPAGGALATALVSGLTGLTPGVYVAPASQPLPFRLGGVTVSVNNDYAPLLAVVVPSDASVYVQVNFQVPLSASASYGFNIVGALPLYSGDISVNEAVQTATGGLAVWGGFFFIGTGYVAAIHTSDSSAVTPQNPAHPGESIIAYADDFFTTWPPPPIAIPAPTQVAFQLGYPRQTGSKYLYLQTYPVPNPVLCANNGSACPGSVTNTPALKINSMALAPGMVGVEAINFVVPSNQQPGNWALFFNAGSCPDGSGIPGTCGALPPGNSSPYVLLPVD
ncbi:MAG TPA: hypothetical protein VH639_20115 [Bryobacteraceae bacterium]|jgi:uncharacterized protein (TIGR03437 family)